METERNYGIEIDELKQGIAEIKELLTSLKESPKEKTSEKESKWTPEAQKKIEDAQEWAKQTNNELGALFYHGFLDIGHNTSYGRGARWDLKCGINELMDMPQDNLSVVLSSLGNQQRWEMLCALLQKPMTVAQLMEKFEMKTSGTAYHHLNALIAADLLEEVKHEKFERGTYAVKGHRVSGVVLIMAGVADLTSSRYSSGEWKV